MYDHDLGPGTSGTFGVIHQPQLHGPAFIHPAQYHHPQSSFLPSLVCDSGQGRSHSISDPQFQQDVVSPSFTEQGSYPVFTTFKTDHLIELQYWRGSETS